MSEDETFVDVLLNARAKIEDSLRRQKLELTILFTDIVGCVEFFETFGDTAGLALLRRHAGLGEKTIEDFGGKVVKTIGDSLMAEFATPRAAVVAAIAIQQRLLEHNQRLPERDRFQLRIGINHGQCFRHDSDIYGSAVNIAARVTKQTGPAQILISHSVQVGLAGESEIRVVALGRFPMKGKKERQELFEVIWTDEKCYHELRGNLTAALRRGELIHSTVCPTGPQTESETQPPVSAMQRAPNLSSISARYLVLQEIGRGNYGVVFKARDKETGEKVALKVLRTEIATDPTAVRAFREEVRLARRISHKNVCRIHEFYRTEETAFIVMELVIGRSLRSILNQFGVMGRPDSHSVPFRYGLEKACQICTGLSEAHRLGIIHRDLKPENVMMTFAGEIKLMDFGIARLTTGGHAQRSTVLGTPAYMAPEQAEGGQVDHRADIYALGLILYEMFIGAPAFSADSPIAVALKHVRELPIPPSQVVPTIPKNLEKIILKCLQKKPEKRFQTVDDVEIALMRAIRGIAGKG